MRTLRIVVSAVVLAALSSLGATVAQAEAAPSPHVVQLNGWHW